MSAMAKRDHLGFANLEEMLSEKFHMTPALLRALNPDAELEAGNAIMVVNLGEQTISGSVTSHRGRQGQVRSSCI